MMLYENWKLNRTKLARYYELTKLEISDREIDLEGFENETNQLEGKLSRRSVAFTESQKEYDIKDIGDKLGFNEAYLDIVRLRHYSFENKQWTDSVQYLVYIVTSDEKQKSLSFTVLPGGNKLENKALKHYSSHSNGKNKDLPDLKSYKNYWKPIAKKA